MRTLWAFVPIVAFLSMVPSSQATSPAVGVESGTRGEISLAERDRLRFVSVSTPDPTGDISSVVIFGSNSVYLKQGATVISGNVVANDASEGPTLACGDNEVCVGVSVNTGPDTDILGDSIQVKSGADIQGAVYCNELDNNGSNPGLSCGQVSLPVIEFLPPFIEQAPRPDAPSITVLIGESIVLPAGDYGILKVKKNGVVRFTGGIYNFEEIDSGTSTDLIFDAPSEIRVAGKFSLDQNSTLGSDMGVAASQILFYVAGVNGNSGNFGATPRAAKIGVGATVSANFYVPNGTLWLRQNSVTTGSFLARDTILGDGATTSLDSAFGNQPPTADPQSVSTGGAGMLTITLTGSDPEEFDLTFSIQDDPLNGTLTDLTPIVPDPIEERDEQGNPTGVFIQPPIVSATVKYTPDTPAAEEEDSFVFKVTDVAGAMGTAVVTINPPPEGEGEPPPPQEVIEAFDADLQIASNTPQTIPLGFAAPEGVSVTVSITSLPSNGSLVDSSANPIASVPYALPDNLVTYTSSLDFVGSDSFDFEAAGEIEGQPASDEATVSIDVAAQFLLAEDSQVTTDRNTPVTVTLEGNPGGAGDSSGPMSLSARHKFIFRATALDGAVVAANVSDADDDGLGDGKDPLPGPSPELIAAGVDVNLGSGGPIEGVARIHMEFDVRALPLLAAEIDSATVTLTTEKSTGDSLTTNFFVGCSAGATGCPGQDGVLSESDFETPLFQLFGVNMPVPAEAADGEEGTFQFNVTGFVASLNNDYISIQGRVNENLAGGGFQSGLHIHSNADGNLALGKEPKLEVTTPEGVSFTLVFTILSLPANGTLTDPANGNAAVQVGDRFIGTTELLYTPDLNFAGSDGFSYQVAEGIVTGTANVDITVNPTDNCTENGRPVGCSPGQ